MPRAHTLLSFLLVFFLAAGLAAQTYVGGNGGAVTRQADPILRADGTLLYFTRPDFSSNQGKENKADIWQVQRYADGSWGRAINPGSPINSFAHDRIIGLSPDGSRMAVLRRGSANFIDLLETSGRNWRITGSWPLPDDVTDRFGLTFDLNAHQLIYSAYAGGHLDLHRRNARGRGDWSAPFRLPTVNGPGNETAPCLAADGRTLYFRRDGGRWFRQDNPGERPVATQLPATALQLSPTLTGHTLVATVNASGSGERLQVVEVTDSDLPQPVELYRAYLPSPLLPGETTARVQLMDGRELTVVPDALNRYALFLRAGENIAGSANAGIATGENAGMATTGLAPSAATDRKILMAGIASRQRELDRLDAERRKYQLVAPATDDPEMMLLREQLSRANGDTLPPVSNVRDLQREQRYAAELAELERMKAKFRAQQSGQLNQGSRSSRNFTEKSGRAGGGTTPAAAPAPAAFGQPSAYPPAMTPAARRRAYEDSIRYAAEIRNGLYRDRAPRAYERQPWENEVREGLPRTEPVSPDEAARLDAEYQRRLAELESLRAQLRQTEGRTAPATTGQRWEARGPVSPAPAAYGQSAGVPEAYSPATAPATYPAPASAPAGYGTPAPAGLTGAPMPAGISFIPNTAYPDSRGYTGLDQLLGLVRQSAAVLEIRVHTARNLNPRAAQRLSEERATTIRNFLLSQQVSPNNFVVTGYGHNLTGEQGERVEVVRR